VHNDYCSCSCCCSLFSCALLCQGEDMLSDLKHSKRVPASRKEEAEEEEEEEEGEGRGAAPGVGRLLGLPRGLSGGRGVHQWRGKVLYGTAFTALYSTMYSHCRPLCRPRAHPRPSPAPSQASLCRLSHSYSHSHSLFLTHCPSSSLFCPPLCFQVLLWGLPVPPPTRRTRGPHQPPHRDAPVPPVPRLPPQPREPVTDTALVRRGCTRGTSQGKCARAHPGKVQWAEVEGRGREWGRRGAGERGERGRGEGEEGETREGEEGGGGSAGKRRLEARRGEGGRLYVYGGDMEGLPVMISVMQCPELTTLSSLSEASLGQYSTSTNSTAARSAAPAGGGTAGGGTAGGGTAGGATAGGVTAGGQAWAYRPVPGEFMVRDAMKVPWFGPVASFLTCPRKLSIPGQTP